MPNVRGIQSLDCGVSGTSLDFSMDDGTTSQIVYSAPLVDGTWSIIANDPLSLTPFLDLHANMLRIKIEQVALCGVLAPVNRGLLVKKDPAFQWPCRNGVDGCPFEGGGGPTPWDTHFALFDSGTPHDCCTFGNELDLSLAKADLLCPISDCTLMILKVTAVKQAGSGVFSIGFTVDLELIAPP